MPDGQVDKELDGHIAAVGAAKKISMLPGMPDMPGYAAGGGGGGGHFAIESLEELDGFIARFKEVLDDIEDARQELDAAVQRVIPPAGDRASKFEADETIKSLQTALDHNYTMSEYALAYVKKLEATRDDYARTEGDNTSTVDKSGA